MRAPFTRARAYQRLIVSRLADLFLSLRSYRTAPPRSPSDTVREFYKAMREKRFREAFDMSIYKPAIDNLKPQEFEDLRPDFEKMSAAIPLTVNITGEQISGDAATVFVKVKEGDAPEHLNR